MNCVRYVRIFLKLIAKKRVSANPVIPMRRYKEDTALIRPEMCEHRVDPDDTEYTGSQDDDNGGGILFPMPREAAMLLSIKQLKA